MPCARCSGWVENPCWLAATDCTPDRVATLRHKYRDRNSNIIYTVCRPSCIVAHLRRELRQLELGLHFLTYEQIRSKVCVLEYLALEIAYEHQQEVIDGEQDVPGAKSAARAEGAQQQMRLHSRARKWPRRCWRCKKDRAKRS